MAIFGNVCKTHTVRHQTVHKSHYSAPNRVDCEFSSHRLMLIRFEKAGKGLDVDLFCCVAASASASERFQTEQARTNEQNAQKPYRTVQKPHYYAIKTVQKPHYYAIKTVQKTQKPFTI